ncbi:uncharacterized protein BDZ99DRAFT_468995 [Mytilinidion resinicola]|uniref:Uncharacterized protein n=1 Tax=Mytilinidion resinicola TaxID=574789 RepID=A0A6A6Y074_9PEZI|nr:uncharacterized protein BDZ99DRAFT_468995 [Mytilinidion resinicola]KAF2802211.1 hypothetical protein BDZ99DRAFT_468995 [Mytilinidion resinicola]
MEVAGLVISAIGFVDLAIKNGTTLARVLRDSSQAANQVVNATQRLEAQKYTLELWQRTWNTKARQRRKDNLEDGFKDLWGEEGYEMTLKCLAQLNVKFGEAFRTLRSIDPDSFESVTAIGKGPSQQSLPLSPMKETSSNSVSRSPSVSGRSSSSSKLQTQKEPESNPRWYKRLSVSDRNGIWKRKKRPSVASTAEGPADETAAKTMLAQEALQQKLSPGTKFKWSISLKEQLRSLINDIDDWLALLKTLSTQCEIDRTTNSAASNNSDNPSSIRAAARALYTALHVPKGHNLDLKLEKERADSGYFERVFGPVDYVDHTDRSFKFPLLVSSSKDGEQPFLLLAEAIYSSAMTTPVLPLEKINTLEEIVAAIKTKPFKRNEPPASLLFKSQHTTIVIHGIPGAFSPTVAKAFSRCSFAELLKAQVGVDPLVACWKRLQLACIIAISVLHLYETGWISEQFAANDFHFFGAANSQYAEPNGISPYVSALAPQTDLTATPFDCLKKNQLPQSLLRARDVRLATLFHRLGIVLFELGRGAQYREIFTDELPTEGEVLDEIEKIPFGRPYRDLVKVCLTGSLYATSVVNIDSHFNRVVIEQLTRLEQHFSAILHGET